jgi:hypothetical protein
MRDTRDAAIAWGSLIIVTLIITIFSTIHMEAERQHRFKLLEKGAVLTVSLCQ